MPLQNRVDPTGDIHAIDARGMFTGNRGVIHDPDTRRLLKKRWTTKAWIVCDCGFKGRKHAVFGRNARSGGPGWTNLFFLDEVTALSAGHRPCFECRREKAREFADCFGKAFAMRTPTAPEMDERLHATRLASGGRPVAVGEERRLSDFPDGTMFFLGEGMFAKRGKTLRGWIFRGYGEEFDFEDLTRSGLMIATPAPMVAVLDAGYRPVWHPSAFN